MRCPQLPKEVVFREDVDNNVIIYKIMPGRAFRIRTKTKTEAEGIIKLLATLKKDKLLSRCSAGYRD